MNIGDMYDDLTMYEPNKLDEEIVRAVMKFLNSMKMLSNPWIGDTASSVHASTFNYGMIPEAKGGGK
jgi:hypothetical protein